MKQNDNHRQPLPDGLQQILENASDIICLVDADGRFVQVSNNCQKIWGYRAEEIVEQHYQDFVHPEDLQKSQELVERLKREGTPRELRNRFRRPDGTYFPVLWSLYWSTSENLLYGLAKGGTEEQTIQEILLASENKINRFLFSTQEGIYTLDTHYNFDLINPAGEKFLEKITGRRIKPGDNLLQTVPPHRKEALQKLYAPVFNGEKLDYEFAYQTHQGKVWLSVHIDPLVNESGGVTGLLVSTRDISERKAAEERLQLALDAGQIGIWELDLVNDTSIRNERHDQIFGYQEPPSEWGAKKFFEHILPEDRPQVQQAFEEAMASNKLFFECRIKWPDDSVHWITATGKVMRDEFDRFQKPVRMFGTVIDVTQQKKDEEDLRKANEQFHLAAEASFDVIYDLNLETTTVDVNDAITKLLGLPGGENFSVEEMRKCIHPDDKETYLGNLQKFLQSRERYFVHEHRLLKTDGGVVYITMKALAIRRPDGTPYRIVGVLRDMTERKKAEEEIIRINEELHLLSSHLQNVREEERINIAREIHDDLGQQLTGLKMDVFWLAKRLQTGNEAVKEKARTILELTRT